MEAQDAGHTVDSAALVSAEESVEAVVEEDKLRSK
jgi:hypothetical protein